MSVKKISCVALFAMVGLSAFAQGLLLNETNLRDDLNWLNQQGVIQISTSTWPLSGDEIQRALSQAKVSNTTQQKVIASVQQALNNDNAMLKLGAFASTDKQNIPQNFADKEKARYVGFLEGYAGGESWDAKLRVNAESEQRIHDDSHVNFDGSYIAGKAWNQWIIAGQIPTWWGPGHDGSLIRGDASRSVVGVTMQRAEQKAFESKWLSWAGPWQYQLYAGRLKQYNAIPGAQIIGMRLTAQPLPYLELGASRVIQMAGKGQPHSGKAYWNAIIGNDNGCDTAECTGVNNPGNQLGGFDARLNLQPLINAPVSLYGQMIGEDEAGYLPSKYMYQAGVDYSSSFNNMPFQLYTEWSDTRTNGEVRGISYTHHIYKDGYYQQGFPLGHAMGGDGQMYALGGDIRVDQMNRFNGRILYANVNQSNVIVNKAFPEEDKIKALDLTWTHYLKPSIPLKLNAWVSDSDKHGNDTGGSIGIEIPLDKHLF